MFNGYMRKVVFPLVGLVAIGWILIIIGFGIETNQESDSIPADLSIGFGIETNQESVPIPAVPIPTDLPIGFVPIQADSSISYSWWMVILVTPFMLVMAVVQAAIDNNRLIMNIIGAITTFLSALFLTGLGYLLTYYGLRVDFATQVDITVDYASLQFSGAIIATIFWVALTCVSHFYERDGDLVTG